MKRDWKLNFLQSPNDRKMINVLINEHNCK